MSTINLAISTITQVMSSVSTRTSTMTTAVSTGGGNPAEVIDHVNGFIDKIFSPDTIGPTGSVDNDGNAVPME